MTNFIYCHGTSTNVFKMAVAYDEELVQDISVTYYQAERMTLTKSKGELNIYPFKDSFIVECKLSAKETALFAGTNLDTYAQVKLVIGDKVLFGRKDRIRVIETIEEK